MLPILSIIYEDHELLVVNKPSNLVSEPGCQNQHHTLVDLLYQYDPRLQQLPRGGLVHRLDKDTTGLLLVGKSLAAMAYLQAQFKTKTISRRYTVLVHTRVPKNAGRIATGLTKCWKRSMVIVSNQGQPAVTYYQVLKRFQHYTLLQCVLETGKTHQIRVHLQHLKYYVVGDRLYSAHLKTLTMPRQALHATHLAFQHPLTQRHMTLSCPLPVDFQQLIDLLENNHASIIR